MANNPNIPGKICYIDSSGKFQMDFDSCKNLDQGGLTLERTCSGKQLGPYIFYPCDAGCNDKTGTCFKDSDGDKVPDEKDGCPTSSLKSSPGVCGCNIADNDSDGDGVLDCKDNCPAVANNNQQDTDSDGVGDVCDGCPTSPLKSSPGICGCSTSPDQESKDSDGDGMVDCQDQCPDDKTKVSPGLCGCGMPDVNVDNDGDGLVDCQDNCSAVPNKDQQDTDGDKIGDACDNCPLMPNFNQDDDDNDGVGNVCDNCVTGTDGISNCVPKARVVSLCGKKRENWPFNLQMGAQPQGNACTPSPNLNCLFASEQEYFLFKTTAPTLFTFPDEYDYDKIKLVSSKAVKACTHNLDKGQQSQYKKYDNSKFNFWNTSGSYGEKHYIVDYPGPCDPTATLTQVWLNPEEYNRLAIRVVDKNNVTPPPANDPSLIECSVP